jgi:phosphatidylserine/phosphatidylglycerophosphate/cardiolipin synthase-like enzyme
MIRGARRTLDLEHFYLSHRPGEALEPVLAEIGRAAKRGVRVRLLLDGAMYRTYPRTADSLGRLANVQVRRVDWRRAAGAGVQHAKFMIADRRSVWLGSQNLDWRALSQIHELGVRVDDARVAGAVASVFDTDWAAADTTRPAEPAALPVLPLPISLVQSPGDTAHLVPSASPRRLTPAAIPWDRDVLVALIDGARRELVAQALGYGTTSRGETDSTLDHSLRRAAARGVKVKLVFSDWCGEDDIAALRGLADVPGIEVRISRVPDWSGGYVPFARVEHCKIAVADGERVWIGTSNWEPGYFSNSRNLGLTIANARLAGQVRRTFETSWNDPHALPLLRDTPFTTRVRGETPPPGVKVYGE